MLVQCSLEDWSKNLICEPVWLCALPCSYHELASDHGLGFTEFEEEGLGQMVYAVVLLNDTPLHLLSPASPPDDAEEVYVQVHGEQPDWSKLIGTLCSEVGIDRDAIAWEQDELVQGTWRLMRQDDSGNTAQMYLFPDEMRAEQARAIYERRGHKQTYFIERNN